MPLSFCSKAAPLCKAWLKALTVKLGAKPSTKLPPVINEVVLVCGGNDVVIFHKLLDIFYSSLIIDVIEFIRNQI